MRTRQITFLTITLVLIAFEIYSGSSSYQALMGLWGIKSWSLLIAFAVVAVDFGAVALLFTETVQIREPWYILIAWSLSAIGDTYLSYVVISAEAQTLTSNLMVQSGTVSLEFFTKTIPALVAVFSWGVQTLLVVSFNNMIRSGYGRVQTSNQRSVTRSNPQRGSTRTTPVDTDW